MKKLHYTELGLVNTRAMFAQAMEEQFAVPAYNFNNIFPEWFGIKVDFRAARAARPGLKAVPKPGDKDTSDALRHVDEEGPKGRGTQADPAKGGATEGASDKGRDRSSSGSSVSPVGDASAPTEGDTPEKDAVIAPQSESPHDVAAYVSRETSPLHDSGGWEPAPF